MIRAQVTGPADGKIADGTQVGIAPHLVDMNIGTVVMRHGDALMCGYIEIDGGAPRLMLQIGERGCQCGCGAHGRGMMMTPDPAFARDIGQTLIRMADEMEARAADQAPAALAKAAGK